MSKDVEESIYYGLDSICDQLERLKGRLYTNDNERADRNCPKLYNVQKILYEVMNDYSRFIEEA